MSGGQLFLVRWPNRNISLVKANDRQDVISKFDEFSNSGKKKKKKKFKN